MNRKLVRKYQPIWEAIRQHRHVYIQAPVENHLKIRGMVVKEKVKDDLFHSRYPGATMSFTFFSTHEHERGAGIEIKLHLTNTRTIFLQKLLPEYTIDGGNL